MESKTIAIVKENRCTGCGACCNICPVQAISMQYNKDGFLFPIIDERKCIHCGKCCQCCPEVDFDKTESFRHPLGECYAVMASDEVRWVSSSGGMFTLLANYVLGQGGIVFGAAYADDCMSVHHIGVESMDQLGRLRSSKYVQSGTEDTYRRVREALKENRRVLFTGCPCQIAGLYRYLGKDDDNLITADLICHAANSTTAYQSFLREIAKGREVTEVDFRKKENYGWITNVNIYFKDGTSYIEDPDKTKAAWYIGFLGGVINRRCCAICHYTQLKRMGDFTLGDFWKVSQLNPEWHDGKGTSLVLVNSEKAAKVLEQVKPDMKLCARAQIDEQFARKANGQLVRPTKQHPGRRVFFDMLPKVGYHKALKEAMAAFPAEKKEAAKPAAAAQKEIKLAPKPHYDVGITGYWWSSNYGSVATYYALYKLIEQMGKSVILIDRPEKEKHGDGLDVFSRVFMETHLNTTESLKWDQLEAFNSLCDTYVIGSDQVWAPGAITAYQYFFFLDFIRPDKRKVAYAASFGEHFEVDAERQRLAKKYIGQFSDISVREFQAVDICRRKFGQEATWVMDPVFLLDRSEWDHLASQAKRSVTDVLGAHKDYILTYILNPSEEKRNMILEAERHLGLPTINILHGKAHSFEKNNKIMQLPNTLQDVSEEEWLYYIKNARYVITDSHHGSALAIIYNKQFICCSDKKWGQARYESLFGLLGIKARQSITVRDMLDRKLLSSHIDYEQVNSILSERREQSYTWLLNAICGKQAVQLRQLMADNKELKERLAALEAQVRKLSEER